MPALTIKNIPEPLMESLREQAQLNHRSLNKEVLFCLDQALKPTSVRVSDSLTRIRALRNQAPKAILDETILAEADAGRP